MLLKFSWRIKHCCLTTDDELHWLWRWCAMLDISVTAVLLMTQFVHRGHLMWFWLWSELSMVNDADVFVYHYKCLTSVVCWQTSNLMNPPRNRENTALMIDRKAVVKPAAGRPRAALGNISNKTAAPTKNVSMKVVSALHVNSKDYKLCMSLN